MFLTVRSPRSWKSSARFSICDIDAVAQDVVAVDDDVAEIDADAELQPPPRLYVGVALGNPGLDRIGAIDGVHDAGELGQQPVACRIDDAATMTGNLGRKHRLPVLSQTAHGAFLVLAHQSAVANDIRRQNGHQPALQTSLRRAQPQLSSACFRLSGPR
jgi:hypothetical protein